MPATLERLVDLYQLRGGPEHHEYGDPYTYSATLNIYDSTCLIKGLSGQVSAKLRDDLYNLLEPMGVKTICFERRKNGRMTKHECGVKDL